MNRRAWLYFLAVSLLWGIPYFFIKVALRDLGPVAIAFVRVAIGAAVLLPLALRSGSLARIRERWPQAIVLGLVEVATPFALIPAGEESIPSSLAGILIATEPLMIALVAIPFDPSERVGRMRLLGLFVGLAGVVVMLGLGGGGGVSLLGAALILLATLGYSIGALLVKRWFSDVPSIGVATSTLCVGAVALLIPAALGAPHTVPSGATIVALLILGVGCTAVGLLCFFLLIGEVGAGRAAVITYVAPVVATALGVGLAGELFTPSTAVGFALILLGSWLSTAKDPKSSHIAFQGTLQGRTTTERRER